MKNKKVNDCLQALWDLYSKAHSELTDSAIINGFKSQCMKLIPDTFEKEEIEEFLETISLQSEIAELEAKLAKLKAKNKVKDTTPYVADPCSTGRSSNSRC